MPEALDPGEDQGSIAEKVVREPGPRGEGHGGQVSRPPALEVGFDGGDISPDKIPVADLALVIRAVQ